MATDYPLLSTIDPVVLIALGTLFLGTMGSAVAFAISKERKKFWYSVTLALSFVCLMISAVCIALALR